ncbi:Ig-like domain-containing protein [Bdellovibrio sp. HCB209]|uniref:RCC1 domain-containing protein n=1 Tax=Bdellovibrio sp. HCB209 TaxID=3394354 RepID=UPI0039B421F4
MVFHYTNSYMVRVGRVVLLPLLLALAACTDANVSVSMLSQNLSGSVNVSISSSAGSSTNLSSIPVDVKFSEDVENITTSSFEVTNGTIQTITGSGANYSLVVVPNGDGAVSVKFLPGKVDIKKNSGSFQKKAAGTPLSVVADTVAPMVLSLTSLDGSITNKSVINFKVEFSEPVTGFDINQLSVSGAGAAVTGVTGSGAVYNVQVSVSITGQLTLYALPGSVRDGAGNLLGTSSPISVTYDPTLPIPVLSSSAGSLTNLSLIPITVDFGSVSVTGLTMSDFVVAGATISGFSQAGSIYTVTLSPTADGVISISLPADAATSLSGVASLASNNLDITVDRMAPVIAIGTPTPSYGTSAAEFKWLVTYSGADLITLNSADVTLLGNSAGCSKSVVAQTASSYFVVVTGCTGIGSMMFTLAAQTAQDAAGNYAAAAASSSVVVDSMTYVVSLAAHSDFVAEGSSANQQSFTVNLGTAGVAPVTINYRIAKALSSAANNTDFVLSTSSVTIPAGQTSATINYTYNGDTSAGGSKIIQIGLSDVETASGAPALTNVTVARRLVVDEELSNFYSEIATTTNHSCGITSTGVLKCWGSYLYETPYTSSTGVPVVVDSGVAYSKISTSSTHTCGITSAGVLKCWGINANGQLGDSTAITRTAPVVADVGTSYKEVSVGTSFTCGITTADSLKCWGLNTSGQLGLGSTINATPTSVDTGVAYSTVTAGSAHACALTTAGVMKCWGSNNFGQVGNGTTTNVTTPYTVDSGAAFSSIATGAAFSCGVNGTKKIKCWGLNAAGQLGIGSTTNQTSPTVVDSAVDYEKVGAGSGAACGITSAGALRCWGLNALNALGDGTLTNATAPIAIDAGSTYAKIAPGGNHMCGILTNGIAKCWGGNLYGQTGDGLPQYVHTPKSVEDSSVYEKVSNSISHTCGIVASSGALRCWGDNSYGELGDNSTNSRSIPFRVDRNDQYKDVSVGDYFTCAVSKNGHLKCWGLNTNSQLGDGTTTNRKKPVLIDDGVLYNKVSAGVSHVCAITTAGILKCWGLGTSGQIGSGSMTTKSTPTVIDSGVSYADVSAGESHTCGITTGKTVKCWGANTYYQVSQTGANTYSPTIVDSGILYNSIQAGDQHTCGITSSDNLVKCWGQNSSGQIGQGTNTSSVSIPTAILGGETYSSISAGSSHNCGVTSSGQLKCWGYNGSGQLGDGTYVAKSSPTAVSASGDTYTGVAAGSSTCGILQSGLLKCWGADSYGQLGLGRSWGRPLPIIP